MVPGIPSLGGGELLILLAIILLFFGAKRVPQLGRSLGKSMREFRKAAAEDSEAVEAREPEEPEKPSLKEEQARPGEAHDPVTHENIHPEQPAERKP
jgi:sec-independent protein translocase protein TatA